MIQIWVEFLKEDYFLIIYGLTFIISIISYRKYFDTILKYFPIIIAYTFFNELLGYLIRYKKDFTFFPKTELLAANDLIYNVYDIVFYSFFFMVYWKSMSSVKSKKIVLIGVVISALSYIISLFFQNPLYVLLYCASAISGWVLFFSSILYLVHLKFTLNWKLQKHNLMLWVSIGISVFYFAFPILIIVGFTNFELWEKFNLRTVLRVFILIMYTFFIIGFLKSNRKVFG